MARFKMICPHCGISFEARTGLFARNVVRCEACRQLIDLKRDAMEAVTCAQCGNAVLLNRRLGEKAVCPVCRAQLITRDSMMRFIDLACSACGTPLHVLKGARSAVCPVCETVNDLSAAQYVAQRAGGMAPVVISNTGASGEALVWKHPLRDFVNGTNLRVSEGQCAVFISDGEMLGSYEPGLHKLNTNIREGDGVGPHSAAVYFINTAALEPQRWGIFNVTLQDPEYGTVVDLGASGTITLHVREPRKLIGKLGAASDTLTLTDLFGEGSTIGRFLALVQQRARSGIASYLVENNVSLFKVDANLLALSTALKKHVEADPQIDSYGLEVVELSVERVQLPSREANPTFWEIRDLMGQDQLIGIKHKLEMLKAKNEADISHVQADSNSDVEVINARGRAQANSVLGIDERTRRTLDTLDTAVQQPAARVDAPFEGVPVTPVTPAAAITNAVANKAVESAAAVLDASTSEKPGIKCRFCDNVAPAGSKFCNMCGKPIAPEKVFCIYCGRELPSGARYCSFCGKSQE